MTYFFIGLFAPLLLYLAIFSTIGVCIVSMLWVLGIKEDVFSEEYEKRIL